jgi:hypothetical protein
LSSKEHFELSSKEQGPSLSLTSNRTAVESETRFERDHPSMLSQDSSGFRRKTFDATSILARRLSLPY